MQTLEEVIDDVLLNAKSAETLDELTKSVATAVRAFLGSEEVIKEAAATIDAASGDIYNMCEFGRPFDFDELAHNVVRALLKGE